MLVAKIGQWVKILSQKPCFALLSVLCMLEWILVNQHFGVWKAVVSTSEVLC
jgi:hypothetical protein